jgi:SsuE family FMN reductase
MSTVVTVSGSPAEDSTTHAVLRHVRRRLEVAGHRVVAVRPRNLPAAALLAGDVDDPAVAAAVRTIRAADGVVVASPVFNASISGLLKVFLDALPQRAFAGTPVLPLMTGGSLAHVLAVDHALRPVLQALSAAPVLAGRFVLSEHARRYPDGGLLLDPVAAVGLADATDALLAQLEHRPVPHLFAASGRRFSPVAGAPDLTVHLVAPDDPRLHPLLAELMVEYSTRYATGGPHELLTEVPVTDFELPSGTFVILQDGGETVAGGALRRYDATTAEVKRVWTSMRHRRRGLAGRLMAELERVAGELGHERIHLTTGPRQPEARRLYLAAGYTPRFDTALAPELVGVHAFGKELVPGAGLVEWPPAAVPLPEPATR